MKLKKRIMLVVSMAIMTLSTVLSSMQVHAANTSNYKYVVFSEKTYTRDYMNICTVELLDNGQAVNVDGTVWRYDDDGMFHVEIIANMPIYIQYLTNGGNGTIYFSDDTTDFLWFFDGLIHWDWVENFLNDSAEFHCSMSLMDLNLNVYGQEYDIPFESNSGLQDPSARGQVDLNKYVYVQNVPETRHLSYLDCELEAKFMLSFSYSDYLGTDMSFTPRWRYSLNGLKFYEFYGMDTMVLKAILDCLETIEGLTADEKALMQTYYPKLNQMLILLQNNITPDVQDILFYTEAILAEFERANISLDTNNSELKILNSRMVNIHEELISIHQTLIEQSSEDKSETDSLKQNSDSQSSQLDSLNQQTQMEKIDVDNASGVVDQNLNINTDANYGVLLSTFTSNGKILTMLLAVSSIGLISYVLFGKR